MSPIVLEQHTIVRVVNPTGRLSAVGRQKLRAMLGGPDITKDETNSIARNTQFELYVGAVLAFGGVSLELEEPDLTVQYLGRVTGIAAKRVRSPPELERRVGDPVEPVTRSGSPVSSRSTLIAWLPGLERPRQLTFWQDVLSEIKKNQAEMWYIVRSHRG